MIVTAKTPTEWQALAGFLKHYAGVDPSVDLRCFGWVSEDKLVIVVGLHNFMGKIAQIHVAFAPDWHFAPRAMLREVFHYAFNTAGRDLLLGVVNSKNERALRMDTHLGFKELYRLPGLHDDGGDVVLMGMWKGECRYLEKPAELAAAGGAR